MTGFFNPFARRRSGQPEHVKAIKNWTRNALGCGDSVTISINQLACAEPGCPPQETVILALPPYAPPIKLSIHKALAEIAETDIQAAVARWQLRALNKVISSLKT